MATPHRVHIAAAAPAGSVLRRESEGRDSLQPKVLRMGKPIPAAVDHVVFSVINPLILPPQRCCCKDSGRPLLCLNDTLMHEWPYQSC